MANCFMNDGPAMTITTVNGNVSNVTNINTSETYREPKSIYFRHYDSDPNFIGRVHELNLLKDSTINNQGNDEKSAIVVVSGLGGIGKTQLVRKFTEKHQSSYKNIIWIYSQQRSLMVEEFEILATNLMITKVKEKSFNLLIGEVFDKLSTSPTVIVFDNVDEIRNTDIVKSLLAVKTSGVRPHVIITSRINQWPNYIHLIKLGVFNATDALEYVSKTLTNPDHKHSDSLKDKKALVKMLQYFPLALRQATSHINHHRVVEHFHITDYVREFSSFQDRMLDSKFFQDDDLDLYEYTTLTTWKVSLAAINKCGATGRLAIRILRIIAYFRPTHIRRDIFLHLKFPVSKPKADTETEVVLAVRLLVNYSMVESESLQSVLSIHTLVQQVIKIELANSSDSLKTILRDGLHIISEMADIKECNEHGISVFQMALKFNELVYEFKTFPFLILRSLLNYGEYVRAINFASEVLQPLITILRDDHRDTPISNLSTVVPYICKRFEAPRTHQEIFEKRKAILTHGNRDTHSCESPTYSIQTPSETIIFHIRGLENPRPNLGRHVETHADGGYTKGYNHSDIIEFRQKVFEKRGTNSSEDDPHPVNVESHFNTMYTKGSDRSETIELREQVFEKRGTNSGEDDPHLANVESQFNTVYTKGSDHSETIELSQRVFETRGTNSGEDDPHLVSVESHFNTMYTKGSDRSETIELRLRVFETRGTNSGEDDPHLVNVESHFNTMYTKGSDRSETIELREQVFEKRGTNSGEDDPLLANVESQFNTVYTKGSDHSETIELSQRVFETRGTNCEDDPHLVNVESRYDAVYTKGSDYSETIDLRQRVSKKQKDDLVEINSNYYNLKQHAFDKLKTKLVEHHPHILECRVYIADLYNHLGKYVEALQIHQEVSEKRKQILGDDHPDTLDSEWNIATMYTRLGKYAEALQLHQKLFEKRKRILRKDHPDILDSEWNIATLCTRLGKYAEALQLHQELFEKRKQILGVDHPDTLDSEWNIATMYSHLGKHAEALQIHQAFEKRKRFVWEDPTDVTK